MEETPGCVDVTKSKFRGCLVAALAGDCYGHPFEFRRKPTPYAEVQPFFDSDTTDENVKDKFPLHYTDDTAMLRSIAFSLTEKGQFDAVDVAHRFTKEFFNNSAVQREYGAHVRRVFEQWKTLGLRERPAVQEEDDLWRPAREQFEGAGSAGNGGAMRVAPVALFCYQDPKKLIEVATKVTQLTHTHRDGVNGALLLTFAIKRALLADKNHFDAVAFLDAVIEDLKPLETSTDPSIWQRLWNQVAPLKQTKLQRVLNYNTEPAIYQKKLEIMKQLLSKDHVPPEEVIEKLDNFVLATGSVPTAIYCCLRGLKQYPDSPSGGELERCLKLAISLGGDADTIATMAGAVMGALIGEDAIPDYIPQRCYGYEDACTLADQLYSVLHKSA